MNCEVPDFKNKNPRNSKQCILARLSYVTSIPVIVLPCFDVTPVMTGLPAPHALQVCFTFNQTKPVG